MDDQDSSLHIRPGVDDSSSRKVKVKKRRRHLSVDEYVAGVRKRDRNILGRAFTLVESTTDLHRGLSAEVIEALLPHTGHSYRVGITGVPGVGKSTFIEALGMHLINEGHRVAVLAVDPSSERTGGSILGDKTRMEQLSIHPDALVRPSPTGKTLGGVARGTREAILVCEAAGFDVILVETVGVGQSETVVASMVDFYLLLMLANAGDELQGIKRGIIELADAIAINKADKENITAAKAAQAQYRSALRFLSSSERGWEPKVVTCSAITGNGLPEIWELISKHHHQQKETGALDRKREEQVIYWMNQTVEAMLIERFYQNPEIKAALDDFKEQTRQGKMSPFAAADQLMSLHAKTTDKPPKES